MLTFAIDQWPTAEDGYEGCNAEPLSFLSQFFTENAPRTLTRVVLVFTLGFGLTFPPDTHLEFPTESSEMNAVEQALLDLTNTTSLREVVITPTPNPFHYDYNSMTPDPDFNVWRTRQFPETVFPRLREAGKLVVLGTLPKNGKAN